MKIEVIKPTKGEKEKKIRVCAYCRVSSNHDDQVSSIKNQIRYYSDLLSKNPQYEFVGIYYDKGVSGTKENRPEFQRMLADARLGKFDLIYTKSISRLARNTMTMISAIRELRELGIGVYFELQNMNTLNLDGEMLLTIYSAFAQAESDNTSELLAMAHRRRVSNGDNSACLSGLYGYSRGEDGEFYPDENAEWVKKMYEMAAEGFGLAEIARYLNLQGVKPYRTQKFSGTVVGKILRNRSYVGEIVRDHYFLDSDGTIKVNDGTYPPLTVSGHHLPIVGIDLWNKAQMQIDKKARGHVEKRMEIPYEELRAEVHKYRGRLFCGECGYIMHGAVEKRRNAGYFVCYGRNNFGKGFCSMNTVPLDVVKDYGEFDGNIYIWKETDSIGHVSYPYVAEADWLKEHTRKSPLLIEPDMETVEWEGKLFCAKCGSMLHRRAKAHWKWHWLCEGNKRKGAEFCSGIKLPDEKVKQMEVTDLKYYFMEVRIDGKGYYSYTREDGYKGRV